MAMRREELDAMLRNTVGPVCSVYFQPPESIRISYPCLIYFLGGLYTKHADDKPYSQIPYWDMTYITRDPDDENILKLANLPQCAMGRPYTSENLYHYSYIIYY